MAPIPAINLLLTGFQGWGSVVSNPSEIIGKHLDGAVLDLQTKKGKASTNCSTRADSSSRLDTTPFNHSASATVTFQPLRVSYRDVEKLVPAMHKSGEWDCIVHLGVGPRNVACTIETGSNATGYEWKDVDGVFAPQLAESRGIAIAGNEARWESTLDCQSCCRQLNEMGFEHVQLSSDPGSFLCGYTTALSLKCAHRDSQQTGAEQVVKRPIPVVFFHVPFCREDKPDSPYTLNELTQVVRALCVLTARQALTDKSRRPEQED